jgi:putative acetyltransferase
LGPVSVEPALQRKGIGGSLIMSGIARLKAQDAKGCIVLGDTRYYPKFGFKPSPRLAPAGLPAEHFMALSIKGDMPDEQIAFHPIFTEA